MHAQDITSVTHLTPQTLIGKYESRGPRYTSYPTAPQFSSEFDTEAFRENMQNRANRNTPLSVYVHVPFCRDICYYCACNKVVTRKPGVSRRYLDHLAMEIEQLSSWLSPSRPVTQLHWGGGTPSYLDGAEMTELMHLLASHFTLLDQGEREYSIELDPRTVDGSSIALLKGLGFNRISLGVQDFDPLVQKTINRIQPFSMVKNLVDVIRDHSFDSLSFDLIQGLPYQDVHTTNATLNKVIELSPDRISCYSYAHLPTRFASQRAIDRHTIPSSKERMLMQEVVAQRLTSEGYRHIGMDHFVKPEDELVRAQINGKLQRNFQGYSVNLAPELIGIGASSISFLGGYLIQNETNLDTYYDRLQRHETCICKGLKLSEEDKFRGAIIAQIICNLSLDFTAFLEAWGIDFHDHFKQVEPRLQQMCDDGLISISKTGLIVTEVGRPFLRNICMLFDEYIPITGSSRIY
jgi:oxygen-independent coproporphyrinogen-3 oxidase